MAAGLADRCTLQLAYAIGVARPLSIYIDTHGTGNVSGDELEKAAARAMDLTPRSTRKHLELNRPIYARNFALKALHPRLEGKRSRTRCA